MVINTVILSYSKTENEYSMTKNAITSLRNAESEHSFNIVVVETNTNLYKEEFCDEVLYNDQKVLTVFPNKKFNYNEFLKFGISSFSEKSEYILILNNDIIASKYFASHLIAAMSLTDSTSALCPKHEHHQIYKHGHNANARIYSNGTQVSLVYGLKISHQLCGWCIMLKQTVIDKIGLEELFPNELNFWYQDRYYGDMLQKYKFKHALVITSKVHHLKSQSYELLSEQEKKERTTDLYKVYVELTNKNNVTRSTT